MYSTQTLLNRLKEAPSGIAEFHNYYGDHKHMDVAAYEPFPEEAPETAVDRCVDLHAEAGYSNLIWACGRSVLLYRSDIPGTAYLGERGGGDGVTTRDLYRQVMESCCPLRRALACCADKEMVLWGRLAMNRHYGTKGWEAVTSPFSLEHPEYHEISRSGDIVSSRLCYGIPEVQQERIDILLEIQRIGAHGLVLDFCRQMPILGYHPVLVEPYIARTGQDPRLIDSSDPAEHVPWFLFRAEVLTEFMRKLRSAVQQQEEMLGRPCPIIARVPDAEEWLMLGYALDIEAWAGEDLIDGTMLSPFPHTRESMGFATSYQVSCMHENDKLCIGGIGSKKLQGRKGWTRPDVTQIYNLANDQYQAGIDGISLYQSESLLRLPYLHPVIHDLADRQAIAGKASGSYDVGKSRVGCDWHSALQGTPAFGVDQNAL